MTIEIVDFPIKNGWIFHSYVSLPEGMNKCGRLMLCKKKSRGMIRFVSALEMAKLIPVCWAIGLRWLRLWLPWNHLGDRHRSILTATHIYIYRYIYTFFLVFERETPIESSDEWAVSPGQSTKIRANLTGLDQHLEPAHGCPKRFGNVYEHVW